MPWLCVSEMFGDERRRKVDLRGSSRKEDRQAVLARAQREREHTKTVLRFVHFVSKQPGGPDAVAPLAPAWQEHVLQRAFSCTSGGGAAGRPAAATDPICCGAAPCLRARA